LIGGVLFGLRQFVLVPAGQAENNSGVVAPQISLTRLSFTGKVGPVAISPDGKHVAYAVNDAGRQNIWLRQVATDSATEISSPSTGFYHSLIFSHDGNYIFFTRSEAADSIRSLFQMPALGGFPKLLVQDVFEGISLSPDDKQIAFIRKSREAGECALMIASV